MKTKKTLARLLGEVMEQRDQAVKALAGAPAMLASARTQADQWRDEFNKEHRDYPLRVLRDAHGGDWTWATERVARRVHEDMGEDQVELRPDGDRWRAMWHYLPCKARRAEGARTEELGRSAPKPTAGEALLDMIRRGISTVEGNDEPA